MKTYQNKDICTKCGGRCCKYLPGGVSPADLTEVTKESLLRLLQTGKYAIDWWEGDYPEYFIRPAIKNCSSIFDPAWGGECVFLTDIGCELPPKERPYQCRMLEPVSEGKRCVKHGGDKETVKNMWKPYNGLIKSIGEKIKKGEA